MLRASTSISRAWTCHAEGPKHPSADEQAVSGLRGLPGEPVRVGEGPGIAADRKPVRAGALRGGAGVFGQPAALVQRKLDRARFSDEFGVLAAEAFRRGQAVNGVEVLA